MKRVVAVIVVVVSTAVLAAPVFIGEHLSVEPKINTRVGMGTNVYTAVNDGTEDLPINGIGRDPSCSAFDGMAITAQFNAKTPPFSFPSDTSELMHTECPSTGPSMQGFGIRRCKFSVDKQTGEAGAGTPMAYFTEVCRYQSSLGIAASSPWNVGTVMTGSTNMATFQIVPQSTVGALYFSIVEPNDTNVFSLVGQPCSGVHCVATGTKLMNQPVAVTVSCSPQVTGPHTATLYIVADTGVHADPIALTCDGVNMNAGPPDIDVMPPSLSLSVAHTMTIGDTITITNAGSDSLQINSITGATPEWKIVSTTPPCAFPCVIAAASSLGVNVELDPSGIGDFTTTFQISSNDPDEPAVMVPAAGQGLGSTLALVTNINPLPFHVGTTAIGSTVTRKVTVTNQPSNIPIMVNAGFSNETGHTWSVTPSFANVAPQAMQDFDISCTPTSAGMQTATFNITSDATDSTSIIFQVSCEGQTGTLSVNPMTIALGDVPAGTGPVVRTVSLTTSGATLPVGTIVENPDIPQITLGTPTSSQVVMGTPTTFTVSFDPGSALGPVSTTIDVSAGTDTRMVTFTANVVQNTSNQCTTVAGFAPDAIDFGGVQVRQSAPTETLTITNNCTSGLLLLQDAAITPTSDFVLLDAPPASLAPGQSANIAVTFAPQDLGAQMATLVIPTSTGTIEIRLVGTGLRGGAAFGPPDSLYACDCASSDPPNAIVILLALVLPLVPRRRRRC